MTDQTTIYVAEPDIPIGMTIDQYRRSRPVRLSWWRRMIARTQAER